MIGVWFRDNLSACAATSPREAFAEAFAWYTSPNYPRDVPHFEAPNRLPVELEQAIEHVIGE